MIERVIILENIDPVVFYGVNNSNIQLLKTLYAKLRFVARGHVIKVIGESELIDKFEVFIRKLEKYCEEFNILNEEVILDIYKGDQPNEVKQDNLIIHGVNGKPIVARTSNQKKLVEAFKDNDLVFALGPAGPGNTYVAIALAVNVYKNRSVTIRECSAANADLGAFFLGYSTALP